MASPGGSILPPDMEPYYTPLLATGLATAALGSICLYYTLVSPGNNSKSAAAAAGADQPPGLAKSFFLFFYSCFIKPHGGDEATGTQQDALESFYKKQAGAYDATRKLLLQGREDMLALASAQLEARASAANGRKKQRIWVDVGGGTGYNIEAMSRFVNVPEFFSSVYLVDFSPSLCDVARKRFEKLGWKNVHVVCEDARKFRLEDYEGDSLGAQVTPSSGSGSAYGYFNPKRSQHGGADLVTMSYSLSMIPDFYSVIDCLTSLLSPQGVFAVVDFYAQSKVDFGFRNFTGGFVGRHVSFLGRCFWRSWFDLDRVSLEPARRDYLEYTFGTLLNINARNKVLGGIPYYIWLGVHKAPFSSSSLPHEIVENIDALVTESPRLYPSGGRKMGDGKSGDALTRAVERSAPEIRSKAFLTAVQNLSANLPLPAFFYQNHHWRIHYDDQLKKHTQFNDEYIYAFTWEDARVDERILKLGPNDVVLAITSAGDNILSYARQGPARIHAVDLNPTQNHLLELKVAAYTALPYEDFWKIFGDGRHPDFRHLLLSKLSPHLSSRAFQYWFSRIDVFAGRSTAGLYDTGGSRHAIRVARWITRLFFCRAAIRDILSSKTLNEQREIWRDRIRPALLSRLLCNLVVSQESFLWAALGVPKNQLAMIEEDHAASEAVKGPEPTAKNTRPHAIWKYMVDTLDPVAEETHIAGDNPYYYVCLAGQFAPRCHPDYLAAKTHAVLSRPGAFDGLRIHTDELDEVIARLAPGTLTVAVVMDSMDWFEPASRAAGQQISRLNRALAMGGRVMLRSSALTPWYIKEFETLGFSARSVGNRRDSVCIDRVNMYASCWICTKVENLPPPTPEMDERITGMDVNPLVL